MFEKLRNSEIIFLMIVSLKSGMENSMIQELNAEADRIMSSSGKIVYASRGESGQANSRKVRSTPYGKKLLR